MNLERLRSNKVRVAVGVLILLAVVGGAYLAFAEQEPVEISNAEELQNMNNDLDADYVLVDDIDASGIENFEPIGSRSEPFTGTFDGDGHTISGLRIDRPEETNVGLFGSVSAENGAVMIENATLEGVDVTGGTVDVTGGTNVGGLIGHNSGGRIDNVHVSGNVSGGNRVGGLVGFKIPSGSGSLAKISKSSADAEVTAEGNAGGLVGVNLAGPFITESYSVSDVTGENAVGGLVGINGGTVEKSYSNGTVTGDEKVGSIAGVNGNRITQSYGAGDVSGRIETGGLVGSNNDRVSDSYWDINTTGQEISAGGTPLMTDEMTGSAARENMEGFDFGETWRTTGDDYPRLAWQDEESDPDRTAE